jgi:heme/copper-type cytochrome/quinol oxidase subunit 2
MYCSSCGSAIKPGLSFCNHCGARLSDSKDLDTAKSPNLTLNLVFFMVATAIFGLAVITGMMAVMKGGLGFDMGHILFFTMLSFFIILGVEGILVWLLVRSLKGDKEKNVEVPVKKLTTQEIIEVQARELAEPPTSITEHTTRTLEPITVKEK